MSDETPRLKLAQLVSLQELNAVTWNEALAQLDALADLCLLGQYVNAPPASPRDGDAYLTGGTPTGAWSGQAYKIASCLDGAWRFYPPFDGLTAFVVPGATLQVYRGGIWSVLSPLLPSGAVAFGDANGLLGGDAQKLFFDAAAKHLGIGTATPWAPLTINLTGTLPPGSAPLGDAIHVIGSDGGSAPRAIINEHYGATPLIQGRRAQGSISAPLPTTAGLSCYNLSGNAWDGSAWQNIAEVNFMTAENATATARGSSITFATTKAGSISRLQRLSIDDDGRLEGGAYADQSYCYQVPATGFAFPVPDTCGGLILNPAATLALGSVVLPAVPKDGQRCRIATTQAITAFTLSAASGQSVRNAPATMAAGAAVTFQFVAALSTWFRIG